MKEKVNYSCSNCSYVTLKWIGCCPECNEWDTFSQNVINKETGTKREVSYQLSKLTNIDTKNALRINSGIFEWDRVTGGGIVPGSFLVLTGDPGIGKSTLLLQIADKIAHAKKVIYISSEESLQQLKSRASRVISEDSSIFFTDDGNLENIFEVLKREQPDLAIIDSIQNCYFEKSTTLPGSISQIKESGFELMRIAKEENIAIIATGHITKEGVIAGPKTLEHIVDAVFYLQSEDQWNGRILRCVKNRFGSMSEIGFFNMEENGLQEMTDINRALLEEFTTSPGSILVSSIEGSRPLILEIQALVVPTKHTMPQRIITGIDYKKVTLIAAILEKYLHIKFSAHDIFFKISGGGKILNNSADLGIALALLSSYFQTALPEKSLAIGEVNLTGQIKPINNGNIHINEAARFGLNNIFVSKKQNLSDQLIKSVFFNSVYELLTIFDNN